MGRKVSAELAARNGGFVAVASDRDWTMHGYGIAQRLKQVSDDVLQVGESSLYPALQRPLVNGWVRAEWGASGEQPPDEVLHADGGGRATTQCGARGVRPNDRRD
jgi:DNA-binding PadR family transcriptional regulator